MPGVKLQKAKKKLSDGLSSWRLKRKGRAALPQASQTSAEASSSCSGNDACSPESASPLTSPSTLNMLPPPPPVHFPDSVRGLEEFLEGCASTRDPYMSDKTLSNGSLSSPVTSAPNLPVGGRPAEGARTGHRQGSTSMKGPLLVGAFCPNIPSERSNSEDYFSDVDTDRSEEALIGEGLFALTNDDVFFTSSPLEHQHCTTANNNHPKHQLEPGYAYDRAHQNSSRDQDVQKKILHNEGCIRGANDGVGERGGDLGRDRGRFKQFCGTVVDRLSESDSSSTEFSSDPEYNSDSTLIDLTMSSEDDSDAGKLETSQLKSDRKTTTLLKGNCRRMQGASYKRHGGESESSLGGSSEPSAGSSSINLSCSTESLNKRLRAEGRLSPEQHTLLCRRELSMPSIDDLELSQLGEKSNSRLSPRPRGLREVDASSSILPSSDVPSCDFNELSPVPSDGVQDYVPSGGEGSLPSSSVPRTAGDVLFTNRGSSPNSRGRLLPEGIACRVPPALVALPFMRAMRPTSADLATLSEIHSMLDLTQPVGDDLLSSRHPIFVHVSPSMPDLSTVEKEERGSQFRQRHLDKPRLPPSLSSSSSSMSLTFPPFSMPLTPIICEGCPTVFVSAAAEGSPVSSSAAESEQVSAASSSDSFAVQDEVNARRSDTESGEETGAVGKSPQPRPQRPAQLNLSGAASPRSILLHPDSARSKPYETIFESPSDSSTSGMGSGGANNTFLLSPPPCRNPGVEDTFPCDFKPRDVKSRRQLSSGASARAHEQQISRIPEDLCLWCQCCDVCETEVHVKQVEFRDIVVKHVQFKDTGVKDVPFRNTGVEDGHIHSDGALDPEALQEPCRLLSAYNVKVCHHPQCTEDNKQLPLLLCRQCDEDIHRRPQFSGHLVLDASKRTSGGLSSNRRPRSPAESDSDREIDRLPRDEDSPDGRQHFLKTPSKVRKGSRSPPSELQNKLKRKKAVKKKSFGKNDRRHHTMDDGLEAALAQIAHPEGPGFVANPSSETEGDGDGEERPRGARQDSASGPPAAHGNSLVGREESPETLLFDPGLSAATPTQRAPLRRQSRITLQDNCFTVKICCNDTEDHEVVGAASNLPLRDALEAALERRGIDINCVNVFIEKSHTPLPLSSDTSFLAGNTLEVKEKDDHGLEMVSQGAGKQRPSSASKATGQNNRNNKSAGRNSRRESIGIPALLEPPPTKQRRGSLQLPYFFASKGDNSQLRAADDPFGSLRGRRGTNLSIDDTFSVPSTSPQGTLTFSEGGKKPKSQKLSVVSLFANTGSASKEREKQDQLQEILTDYSTNGLPPLPHLLSIGRPTFNPAVFEMEPHWSSIVDKEFVRAFSKRQHDQQEAVWELLHTELSYISQIRVIIDVFQNCLLNIQEKGLLTEIELDKLFSSIDKIWDANCRLWQDSFSEVLADTQETRKPLNPSLMKLGFTQEFENLVQPYTRYCTDHKQCVEYMKRSNSESDLFRIFVAWAEAQKQCNRLKLTDLLVKPMQRLTKYSLLLQAILRMTDDDRQRRDLLEMIASVDKFVTSINFSMQQQHELERLEAITTKIEQYDAVDAPNDECFRIMQEYNSSFNLLSPLSGFHALQSRSLLMHSNLRMKDFKERMEVDCFLFTDLMLICKSNKRCDKYKIIKPPMRLDQIVVSELKDKGSFLLIYLNEYHIPISALTFHGDQGGVRSWLEKIREAQIEYRDKKMEDTRQHLNASSITEQVEYTPMHPAPGRLNVAPNLPRTDSCESAEGQFLPNIALAKPTNSANPLPHTSQTNFQSRGGPLERSGSYTEMPPSTAVSRVLQHNRHVSSSPEFSPASERHRPVKACHSVPNMTAELQVAYRDEDTYNDEHDRVIGGLSMNELSVRGASDVSPYSSVSNLAEPGPVEDDRTSHLQQNKPGGQRRTSRSEKRYYTADCIQELRQQTNKDSSIHKRLSWQNADHVEEKLGKKVLSSDSVTSVPSSSGVSSTASLHFQPESDISEEGETIIQRSGSSQTLLGDGSNTSSNSLGTDLVSNSPRAKSVPDFVTLFSSLKTGDQEDGISSVDLPPGVAEGDGLKGQKLTASQIRHMKKLLLNTDVEASEV